MMGVRFLSSPDFGVLVNKIASCLLSEAVGGNKLRGSQWGLAQVLYGALGMHGCPIGHSQVWWAWESVSPKANPPASGCILCANKVWEGQAVFPVFFLLGNGC